MLRRMRWGNMDRARSRDVMTSGELTMMDQLVGRIPEAINNNATSNHKRMEKGKDVKDVKAVPKAKVKIVMAKATDMLAKAILPIKIIQM